MAALERTPDQPRTKPSRPTELPPSERRRAHRRPPGDPKRAVAYVRASTDEQLLGPADQRRALAAWSAAHGIELVEVLEEHASGRDPIERRPVLLDALGALRRHGAGLLVALRRDRFARDVLVAELLEDAAAREGARVVTVDGTGGDSPEATLTRQIVDAAAQYEGTMIRVRTRAALRAKRARGEATGGVAPYGSRIVAGRLVDEPAELGAVVRAKELRAGGLSLRLITQALRREGFRPRGTAWHLSTVARLLRREEQTSRR